MATETYDKITIHGLTLENDDDTFPSQDSCYMIDNFFGGAKCTTNVALSNIITGPVIANTGKISTLISTSCTTSGIITVYRDVQINTIYGSIRAQNLRFRGTSPNYLAANNKLALWQYSTNRATISRPANIAVDTYTNILGWIPALIQNTSIATPTDRASSISAINALITLLSSRGILTATDQIAPSITGITVDPDGFTVSWTGVATKLFVDNQSYAVTGSSHSVTGFPNANFFPYILRLSGPSGLLSTPFPVSICNITPTDTYFGTAGLCPTSRYYFRTTVPNTINFILLISEQVPISYNARFHISGSNATHDTPIGFRFWDGTSYNYSDVKLTTPAAVTLTYFNTQRIWV